MTNVRSTGGSLVSGLQIVVSVTELRQGGTKVSVPIGICSDMCRGGVSETRANSGKPALPGLSHPNSTLVSFTEPNLQDIFGGGPFSVIGMDAPFGILERPFAAEKCSSLPRKIEMKPQQGPFRQGY